MARLASLVIERESDNAKVAAHRQACSPIVCGVVGGGRRVGCRCQIWLPAAASFDLRLSDLIPHYYHVSSCSSHLIKGLADNGLGMGDF